MCTRKPGILRLSLAIATFLLWFGSNGRCLATFLKKPLLSGSSTGDVITLGGNTAGANSPRPGLPFGTGALTLNRPDTNNQAFVELQRLPNILCYYAARREWPSYSPQIHGAVLDLGRHIFTLDDYGLRNYCAKYVPILAVHRPCCSYPVYPMIINPSFGNNGFGIATKGNKHPVARPAFDEKVDQDAEVSPVDDIDSDVVAVEEGELPAADYDDETPSERLQIDAKPSCLEIDNNCSPGGKVSFIPLQSDGSKKQV